MQLTTRMPWLPSEYSIRRTASPSLSGSEGSMKSVGGLALPSPFSHLTSPVTSYVPLPVGTLLELKVCQVPPPVAALEVPSPPAGATKVPDPVNTIFDPSSAKAAATPPGREFPPWTLSMSHRTWAAGPTATETLARVENSTTASPENHLLSRFMLASSILLKLNQGSYLSSSSKRLLSRDRVLEPVSNRALHLMLISLASAPPEGSDRSGLVVKLPWSASPRRSQTCGP